MSLQIPENNNTLLLANFAANANLATVTEIDNNSTFIINQTTENVTITIPNRTVLNSSELITIVNNGTANLYIKPVGSTFGAELQSNSKIELKCDGAKWVTDNNGGTEFFGALRNTAGTWGLINDAAHQPHNINNVVAGVHPYQVRMDYSIPTEQVATAIITVDDTYSQYGLFAGISQGVSNGSITISKQGFGVYIAYNGTDWVATLGAGEFAVSTDFTFTYAAGVLTVTHTPIVIHKDVFNISATPRGGVHTSLNSVGNTSFQLEFRDIVTGALITTPTTSCRAFVSRNGMWKVENDKLGIGGSNIWVYGKFKN